jgi:hypothetical protein
MIKTAGSALIGVGVGLGVAYWQGIGGEPIGSGLAVEDRAPLEKRLSELETSLAIERYERQALTDALGGLRDSMDAQPARGLGYDVEESSGDPRQRRATASSDGDDDGNDPMAGRIHEASLYGTPGSPEEIEQVVRQQQIERFIAAGIEPVRAQAIMRHEEEVEMAALRAQYAARQSGATPQEIASITPLALLRSELGDTEYAKYLEARDRTTSIGVREVLKSSPAATAGLKPGDEIVGYNGQRVFDMGDLAALAHQARAGTTVPLEVIRDGQSFLVHVEAGPIGISVSPFRSP